MCSGTSELWFVTSIDGNPVVFSFKYSKKTNEPWKIFLTRDRKYRYVLWREWDTSKGTCVFIGLNPSTKLKIHDWSIMKIIEIKTTQREELIDITDKVKQVVMQEGLQNGLVSVYAQGATAAIMIQENWDESVQTDE